MTITVTVQVFSGRPNPTFVLDDKQADELVERASGTGAHTLQRPSGALGGLGYRGFSITRPPSHPRGPLHFMVHEEIADHGPNMPNTVVGPDLERWLAGLAKPHLQTEVAAHLDDSLLPGAAGFALAAAAAACPTIQAADAPAYNPGPWNVPAVQPHNNCYNYANDRITNTFAQPGRATGHPATAMACPNVQAGATSDGLHAVGGFGGRLQRGQGWYVALVIWPNADYHWYRQDQVGCWSHKPGQTVARNTDNAGHTISDPKTCNRGPYTVFCTYMVTNRGVHIS